MHFEKKFVHLFRTFVERALIPQIKRSEGSMAEWNKFSNMISGDNINFNELQNFVDSLSSQTQTITSYEKLQPPSKKKEEMNDFEFGFNPNKTFGG